VNLIAVVDIAHPDLSLAPTIRECPDVTIRVVPQSGTDPETGIFFYLVENAPDGFETHLDEDHTIAEWQPVAGSAATRVYRIRHPPETKLITPKTSELSGLMREATTNARGWTVRLQFPDREALAALADYCDEEDISFTLQQMFRQDEWNGDEPTGLTEAQRVALVTAYENGYFEEPREARLADIAAELDLSPTAIGGRIRRGTAKLVETALLEN
jgi:predicted DNA binding protein